MKDTKDILLNAGIPEEIVSFFRGYQKHLGTKWHMEKNGRFAQNFRYYMKHIPEGLENIPSLDFVVTGAILLSHHGNYFRRVLNENVEDPVAKHELAVIRRDVRALAQYMAKYGAHLRIPYSHSPTFAKVKEKLWLKLREVVSFPQMGRACQEYLAFFCGFPFMWKEGYLQKL